MSKIIIKHFSATPGGLYVIDDKGRIWKKVEGPDSTWHVIAELPEAESSKE